MVKVSKLFFLVAICFCAQIYLIFWIYNVFQVVFYSNNPKIASKYSLYTHIFFNHLFFLFSFFEEMFIIHFYGMENCLSYNFVVKKRFSCFCDKKHVKTLVSYFQIVAHNAY